MNVSYAPRGNGPWSGSLPSIGNHKTTLTRSQITLYPLTILPVGLCRTHAVPGSNTSSTESVSQVLDNPAVTLPTLHTRGSLRNWSLSYSSDSTSPAHGAQGRDATSTSPCSFSTWLLSLALINTSICGVFTAGKETVPLSAPLFKVFH